MGTRSNYQGENCKMYSKKLNSSVCIDDYFSDGILGKIFRHCPSETHEVLRSVSKRWDKVVDRYVGRVLIVKSGNVFMVDPESNMDRMSIRANYWLTLSSGRCLTGDSSSSKPELNTEIVNENESTAIEEVEKLQDISNPDSVRKIGFVGQLGLSGYNPLECILSPCKNITSLFLHLSLFSVSECTDKKYEPWLVSCCLPHLKEMVIDSCGMSSEGSTNLCSYKTTFYCLASFLCSQKFVGLEKAILAVPYLESTEGFIVRSLCIFLGKHADSLKSFSFTQKYKIPENQESSSSGSSDEDESFQHRGDGDRFLGDKGRSAFNFPTDVNYLSLSQLALGAKELKHVYLEEFHMDLAGTQESAPVWKNLLIQQCHMKKCIFAGDKIPLPVGVIERNASSLVTLRLDIRDGVDLKCFRDCVHLRHLSLGGKNDANESREASGDETDSLESQNFEQIIQLKSANCLPFGLESLELVNLRTHKDDARIIALKLPSLRDLIIKNLGWEGNLGLRLCDLANVYKMGRIHHLCIKASLNMMSYSELEADEHSSPEMNLFACVVQSNSFAAASRFFLEVWKRESGLYTTIRKSSCNIEFKEEELDVFQVPNTVELQEEEDSCSDSEEEEDKNDDKGEETEEDDGEEDEQTEEEAGSDDEWQECEDEESDDEEC